MNPVKKIIGEYYDEVGEEVDKTKNRGIPKFDGSGKGIGANVGRGGCVPPKRRGQKNVSEDIVDNIL